MDLLKNVDYAIHWLTRPPPVDPPIREEVVNDAEEDDSENDAPSARGEYWEGRKPQHQIDQNLAELVAPLSDLSMDEDIENWLSDNPLGNFIAESFDIQLPMEPEGIKGRQRKAQKCNGPDPPMIETPRRSQDRNGGKQGQRRSGKYSQMCNDFSTYTVEERIPEITVLTNPDFQSHEPRTMISRNDATSGARGHEYIYSEVIQLKQNDQSYESDDGERVSPASQCTERYPSSKSKTSSKSSRSTSVYDSQNAGDSLTSVVDKEKIATEITRSTSPSLLDKFLTVSDDVYTKVNKALSGSFEMEPTSPFQPFFGDKSPVSSPLAGLKARKDAPELEKVLLQEEPTGINVTFVVDDEEAMTSYPCNETSIEECDQQLEKAILSANASIERPWKPESPRSANASNTDPTFKASKHCLKSKSFRQKSGNEIEATRDTDEVPKLPLPRPDVSGRGPTKSVIESPWLEKVVHSAYESANCHQKSDVSSSQKTKSKKKANGYKKDAPQSPSSCRNVTGREPTRLKTESPWLNKVVSSAYESTTCRRKSESSLQQTKKKEKGTGDCEEAPKTPRPRRGVSGREPVGSETDPPCLEEVVDFAHESAKHCRKPKSSPERTNNEGNLTGNKDDTPQNPLSLVAASNAEPPQPGPESPWLEKVVGSFCDYVQHRGKPAHTVMQTTCDEEETPTNINLRDAAMDRKPILTRPEAPVSVEAKAELLVSVEKGSENLNTKTLHSVQKRPEPRGRPRKRSARREKARKTTPLGPRRYKQHSSQSSEIRSRKSRAMRGSRSSSIRENAMKSIKTFKQSKSRDVKVNEVILSVPASSKPKSVTNVTKVPAKSEKRVFFSLDDESQDREQKRKIVKERQISSRAFSVDSAVSEGASNPGQLNDSHTSRVPESKLAAAPNRAPPHHAKLVTEDPLLECREPFSSLRSNSFDIVHQPRSSKGRIWSTPWAFQCDNRSAVSSDLSSDESSWMKNIVSVIRREKERQPPPGISRKEEDKLWNDSLVVSHQVTQTDLPTVVSVADPSTTDEPELIEVIHVEESFAHSDVFSFGEREGVVFATPGNKGGKPVAWWERQEWKDPDYSSANRNTAAASENTILVAESIPSAGVIGTFQNERKKAAIVEDRDIKDDKVDPEKPQAKNRMKEPIAREQLHATDRRVHVKPTQEWKKLDSSGSRYSSALSENTILFLEGSPSPGETDLCQTSPFWHDENNTSVFEDIKKNKVAPKKLQAKASMREPTSLEKAYGTDRKEHVMPTIVVEDASSDGGSFPTINDGIPSHRHSAHGTTSTIVIPVVPGIGVRDVAGAQHKVSINNTQAAAVDRTAAPARSRDVTLNPSICVVDVSSDDASIQEENEACWTTQSRTSLHNCDGVVLGVVKDDPDAAPDGSSDRLARMSTKMDGTFENNVEVHEENKAANLSRVASPPPRSIGFSSPCSGKTKISQNFPLEKQRSCYEAKSFPTNCLSEVRRPSKLTSCRQVGLDYQELLNEQQSFSQSMSEEISFCEEEENQNRIFPKPTRGEPKQKVARSSSQVGTEDESEACVEKAIAVRSQQMAERSSVLFFKPSINIYGGRGGMQDMVDFTRGFESRAEKSPDKKDIIRNRDFKSRESVPHESQCDIAPGIERQFRDVESVLSQPVAPTARNLTQLSDDNDDDGLDQELRNLEQSEKELRQELAKIQLKSAEYRWCGRTSTPRGRGTTCHVSGRKQKPDFDCIDLSAIPDSFDQPDMRNVDTTSKCSPVVAVTRPPTTVIDLSFYEEKAKASSLDPPGIIAEAKEAKSTEEEQRNDVQVVFIEDSFLSTPSFAFADMQGRAYSLPKDKVDFTGNETPANNDNQDVFRPEPHSGRVMLASADNPAKTLRTVVSSEPSTTGNERKSPTGGNKNATFVSFNAELPAEKPALQDLAANEKCAGYQAKNVARSSSKIFSTDDEFTTGSGRSNVSSDVSDLQSTPSISGLKAFVGAHEKERTVADLNELHSGSSRSNNSSDISDLQSTPSISGLKAFVEAHEDDRTVSDHPESLVSSDEYSDSNGSLDTLFTTEVLGLEGSTGDLEIEMTLSPKRNDELPDSEVLSQGSAKTTLAADIVSLEGTSGQLRIEMTLSPHSLHDCNRRSSGENRSSSGSPETVFTTEMDDASDMRGIELTLSPKTRTGKEPLRVCEATNRCLEIQEQAKSQSCLEETVGNSPRPDFDKIFAPDLSITPEDEDRKGVLTRMGSSKVISQSDLGPPSPIKDFHSSRSTLPTHHTSRDRADTTESFSSRSVLESIASEEAEQRLQELRNAQAEFRREIHQGSPKDASRKPPSTSLASDEEERLLVYPTPLLFGKMPAQAYVSERPKGSNFISCRGDRGEGSSSSKSCLESINSEEAVERLRLLRLSQGAERKAHQVNDPPEESAQKKIDPREQGKKIFRWEMVLDDDSSYSSNFPSQLFINTRPSLSPLENPAAPATMKSTHQSPEKHAAKPRSPLFSRFDRLKTLRSKSKAASPRSIPLSPRDGSRNSLFDSRLRASRRLRKRLGLTKKKSTLGYF